ncbi:MAG: helix-turn-helix domain-containing protein [Muribaculaceae bacterium]|nr:helix-turn-helix domain-containing protein [Muribaculaceae bacterium]
MLFPEKIRQLRIASGKRQKDLAKAIGVDVPAYSRYEHGDRRPKREQVVRLARLFKVDPDELVAAWLADEAYLHIAHDKMANRAAALLQEVITSDATEAAASESQEVADSPVDRDMVARLGRSAMPHLEQGDAATVMQRIEDESIDCIVTTPPYWRRRHQGTESISATSMEDFIEELLQTTAQAWRVLKPNGSMWLNTADDTVDGFIQGLPWRLILAMMDQQGWHLVNAVVWNKTHTSPQGSHDHLRKVHEFMFHLVKSEDFYYNDEELRRTFATIVRNSDKHSKNSQMKQRYKQADNVQGIVPSDVWTIGVQRSGIAHYCVAPDMLYHLPIVATCPPKGIVLDPYCGTGTACKIAYSLDRSSIGIDINKDYVKQARASIEQKPLSLF